MRSPDERTPARGVPTKGEDDSGRTQFAPTGAARTKEVFLRRGRRDVGFPACRGDPCGRPPFDWYEGCFGGRLPPLRDTCYFVGTDILGGPFVGNAVRGWRTVGDDGPYEGGRRNVEKLL